MPWASRHIASMCLLRLIDVPGTPTFPGRFVHLLRYSGRTRMQLNSQNSHHAAASQRKLLSHFHKSCAALHVYLHLQFVGQTDCWHQHRLFQVVIILSPSHFSSQRAIEPLSLHQPNIPRSTHNRLIAKLGRMKGVSMAPEYTNQAQVIIIPFGYQIRRDSEGDLSKHMRTIQSE